MGCHNQVYSHAVLGEQPQHIKYAGEATRVEIGDNNIFREGVTVHRGTTATWTTRIGSHNFFMANSHVAHDCVVGNHCLLANGSLLGGHCVMEDNVFLSGNAALHQFVRAGRLSLLSGCSGTTKDIPPFIIQQNINVVVGVNVVGMRRAGIPVANIDGVRRAFRLLYREGFAVPEGWPASRPRWARCPRWPRCSPSSAPRPAASSSAATARRRKPFAKRHRRGTGHRPSSRQRGDDSRDYAPFDRRTAAVS